MSQNTADKLIIKFIENSISEDEMTSLTLWLQKDENKAYFNGYIELNHVINTKVDFDYRASLEKLNRIIDQKAKTKKLRFFSYAAVAAVVLLVSISYLFENKAFQNTEVEIASPVIVNSTVKIGSDKATLTLDDGTNIVLERDEEYASENAVSNGKEIVYSTTGTEASEIVYNYLTVPRGGQYYVRLSDSTQVWLNSQSQLKYPVRFKKGEAREVELVYGEAYFDVSPSTAHNGAKFIVSNMSQSIEVLGTEFNINAYADEPDITTTLVEGEVKVILDKVSQEVLLSPSRQVVVNKVTNEAAISTVNVNDLTSWRRGIFSFKNMPLDKIMKNLSRWYDIDIVFEDKELQKIPFRGVLKKKQPLKEILTIIKGDNNFDYEIEKNIVRIK